MKRTYEVALPDGSKARRNTESFSYRFALCYRHDESDTWGVVGWSQSYENAWKLSTRAMKYRGSPNYRVLPADLIKGEESYSPDNRPPRKAAPKENV